MRTDELIISLLQEIEGLKDKNELLEHDLAVLESRISKVMGVDYTHRNFELLDCAERYFGNTSLET
jgi:hypothetical protein